MPFNFEVAIALVHTVSAMALVSLVFGMLSRLPLHPFVQSSLLGLVFGAAAIFAMLSSVEISPGAFVDGRATIVGLGALFGGIPVAIISAALAASFRYFALGGFGAPIGATGILVAACIGLGLAHYFRTKTKTTPWHLLISGVAISAHFPVIYLFLPIDRANTGMQDLFPLILVASILGTLVLGTMIGRERRMIRNESELKHSADTDVLTGLINRRALERKIGNWQEQPTADAPVSSILLIDIDHFKQVNDRFGHAEGDLVLKKFGGILQAATRPDDMAARIGGEEFCIYLHGANGDEARDIANRLLSSIRSTTIVAKNQIFQITASIGSAEIDQRATTLDQALRSADIALYEAKNSGRDQLKVASSLGKLAA